ncbi:hypothetical protein DM52_2801 [Burkholderia mallei]|nr:hypothetical protein DM52_2801 [Burkholderia mallei]
MDSETDAYNGPQNGPKPRASARSRIGRQARRTRAFSIRRLRNLLFYPA